MEAAMAKASEAPVKHRTGPDKKGTEDYRGLAERVREAAHRVSIGKERTDLLAMAKIWDFLADHGPHVRH
jgi:sigma54-dependent transcription regulator